MQDLSNGCRKLIHHFFQFPLLSFRSMSPGRRIQNDAFVLLATFRLSFYKRKSIFQQPANIAKSTGLHIFIRPIEDISDRIAMNNVCSTRSS